MRHTSPNNTHGFTLVETMIVAGVMGIITAGLLLAISSGGSAWFIDSGVVEVKAEVRRAASWLSKDIRQGRRVDIGTAANTPTSSHIKFRMITGYSTETGQVLLSPDYIDYTYNPDAKTLTRTDLSNNRSWIFRYIVQPPFYTNNGTAIASITPLQEGGDSAVLQTRNLVIQLVGQKQIKTGATPVFTLTDEVILRNE